MSDLSRWEPVVEELRAEGFDAHLVAGPIETSWIHVDLGDGWSASITTDMTALDDFKAGTPVQVNVDGPGLPGEGYKVTWWPEATNVKRIAKTVTPLLRRLSVQPPQPVEDATASMLETADAEAALRSLLPGPDDDFGPLAFWRAFSAFGLLPMAGLDPSQDQDLLLFEINGSQINLTRQFISAVEPTDDEDDEDQGEMEQLNCSVGVTGASLPSSAIWGPGGPGATDWIAEVEAHASFAAAMARDVLSVEVHQGPV